MSFFKKFFTREKEQDLDKGLEKTKSSLFSKITKAVAGKSTVDEEFLDELEGILVSADVGLETTIKIIERLEERVARDKYINTNELNSLLKSEIVELLSDNKTESVVDDTAPDSNLPYLILVVGGDGAAETTTIGKLADQYKKKGYGVVLVAGDTVRAAAVDQLQI